MLSAAEMRRRLTLRGVPDAIVEQTLAGLMHSGLIEDARMARTLLSRLLDDGRSGPGAIRARLRLRGLDDETITQAWQLEASAIDWTAIALRIRERYDITDSRGRARFARHLARQGFPAALIRRLATADDAADKGSDSDDGLEDH
ncbi:MAG: regulatory protein RecX [Thermaerobacter sp.]|nr:regulatory protein RecX [Thermaerobacter sp.]